MKQVILFILFSIINVFGQQFYVENISGDVKYLAGTSEKWDQIKTGQFLTANTLILAKKKSSVRLVKGEEVFILKGDAAIGLNHLKKVTINDLILALTLDEIRNVPKIKNNGLAKNTAVYGSKQTNNISEKTDSKQLGEKKINGARQLSEKGYKESSIIAAKEIFRNYPEINEKFEERLYFTDLLSDLKLYEEAIEDYTKMTALNLKEEEKNIVEERINTINLKLVKNN